MEGTTYLTISSGISSFTITNLNTIYTELTNFTVSEQNVTEIATSIVRIVEISLPSYVLLTSTTSVTSNNNVESIIVST